MTASNRDKKLVYHLTSIANLESIVRNGLKSRSELANSIPKDVANPEILQGRAKLGLDSLVPFHFMPRTPFDYAVAHAHPDEAFVLLGHRREAARSGEWKICPQHPRHDPRILEWDKGMAAIDWSQMDKYPRNYETDHACKMTCMAEALCPKPVQFCDFTRVFVKNSQVEKQAIAVIKRAGYDRDWPKVQVKESMMPVRRAMAVNFVTGNLFESDAQALVNTVNCVGVMGKGIAYQFKRSFPKMFEDYAERCKAKEVRLGEVYSFRERDRIVINLPTKGHWRAKSKLQDIESGLVALRQLLADESIESVALPPLGCGNGGLAWVSVKAVIAEALAETDVRIDVYEPKGPKFESDVIQVPKLTLSHYIALEIRRLLQGGKKLQFQKAAFFAEHLAREEGYFKFTQYKYGPWSPTIDHVLRVLADYIQAMKLQPDAYESLVERAVSHELAGAEADRLRKWRPAIAKAVRFVNDHWDDAELTATAFAIVQRTPGISKSDLETAFFKWSSAKRTRFSSSDVARGIEVLRSEGLVSETLLGLEPSVLDAAGSKAIAQ